MTRTNERQGCHDSPAKRFSLTHHRARGHKKRWVSAAGLAMLSLVATACHSGSSGGSSASAAAGTDYFHGKTITYIVAGAPGGASAIQIVAMQPVLEKYLGATVKIEYVQGSNTIGQDEVAQAKPDGLTVGTFYSASDLSATFLKTTKVNFSLKDVTFIGSTHQVPGLEVACKGSPYKSAQQLLASKASVSILNVPNSSISLFQHLLMTAYPVSHTYINGYVSATQIVGCQRGDGQTANNAVGSLTDAAGTAMLPGVTPLFTSGPIPSGSPNAFLSNTVPTLAEFAEQHPPTTSLGKEALNALIAFFAANTPQYVTFGPAGIPQAQAQMLTKAFQQAMTTAAVEKAFLAAGIPAGFVAPATVSNYIDSQLAKEPFYETVLKS